MRAFNIFVKRTIDLLGSLIGLIMISPLLLTIAVIIKLTSEGPIFFKQERIGKNGRIFKIIKFRTMIVNAEKIGTGLFVKTERDNRITKIGKILRDNSLDELPQLWNVLIGNMSLVGPRPPVPHHPYEFKDYNNFQRKRFEMKPGITGLTQVEVRNSVSWDERIPYDVKYIQTFNVFLDIKIIFKTLCKMFKSEGIYTHNDVNESKNSSNTN